MATCDHVFNGNCVKEYLKMNMSLPKDAGRRYPDADCVPDADRLRLLIGTVPEVA